MKKSGNLQQTDVGSDGIKLLNSDERRLCEQITTGIAPWNQRAQALLSVDAGATDVSAGEIAGLRDTQVKYWVSAFRRQRMEIFPADLLMGFDISTGESGLNAPEEDAFVTESPGKTIKSKKKKKSKGKKGKETKNKKRKKKKNKGRGKKKSK